MLLLSDIHFGVNSPEEVQRLREAAQVEADESHGVVVVAGDFVQSAVESEYEQAGAFIEELKSMGNLVIGTPGNHDFQIAGAPDGVGSDKINIIPVSMDKARKSYRNYILGPISEQPQVIASGIDGDHESYRYDLVARHGDNIFVCLRSTHRRSFRSAPFGYRTIGRIRKKQFEWVRNVLNEDVKPLQNPNLRVHLVSHRSLWQSRATSEWGIDKHPPLSKGHRVEEFIKEFSVATYIHGHNHRYYFAATDPPNKRYSITRISVPTMCDRVDESERVFLIWDPANPRKIVTWRHDGALELDVVSEVPEPGEKIEIAITDATEKERWEDVIELAERLANTEDRVSTDVLMQKGRAFFETGRFEQAHRLFEEAHERMTEDPHLFEPEAFAKLQKLRGDLKARLGDEHDAARCYELANRYSGATG